MEKAFPVDKTSKSRVSDRPREIPPSLPFSKGGDPFDLISKKDSDFSPFEKGSCEKIGLRPFSVIPAEAGIQYFQDVKNFLDPGFHRGDD